MRKYFIGAAAAAATSVLTIGAAQAQSHGPATVMGAYSIKVPNADGTERYIQNNRYGFRTIHECRLHAVTYLFNFKAWSGVTEAKADFTCNSMVATRRAQPEHGSVGSYSAATEAKVRGARRPYR